MVAGPRIELRAPDNESGMLPLHYPASVLYMAASAASSTPSPFVGLYIDVDILQEVDIELTMDVPPNYE